MVKTSQRSAVDGGRRVPRRRPPSGPRATAGGRSSLAVLLVAVGLASPGCAVLARSQTDQPVAAANVEKVEKGMTKSQVTDLLGAPQEIIFSNKALDPLREHAYIYEYKVTMGTAISFLVISFGNLDSKRDRAIVFFDDNDKVSNVAKSLCADQARYGFPFGR